MLPNTLRERTIMPLTTPTFLVILYPGISKAVVTICLSMLIIVKAPTIKCQGWVKKNYFCKYNINRYSMKKSTVIILWGAITGVANSLFYQVINANDSINKSLAYVSYLIIFAGLLVGTLQY